MQFIASIIFVENGIVGSVLVISNNNIFFKCSFTLGAQLSNIEPEQLVSHFAYIPIDNLKVLIGL